MFLVVIPSWLVVGTTIADALRHDCEDFGAESRGEWGRIFAACLAASRITMTESIEGQREAEDE